MSQANPDVSLLELAAWCPICQTQPVPTEEYIPDAIRTFLRCPKGHPYVASGDNLLFAIENWNRYIAFQIQQDTLHKFREQSVKADASYCPCCKRSTSSRLRFLRVTGPSPYITIQQQCEDCHLMKSEHEAA